MFERIVAHLRAPVHIDPAFGERVMAEIATLPTPTRARPAAAWRRLAPLAALAVAASVLLLIARPASSTRKLQFVLVAPQAATVSLVGDFNDWDAARTPMRPLRADGAVWSAVVPLAPGRYHYAFLVNGSRWLPDPAAPRASDDGFGTPSSVVTVSGT
ncbi:MAG TPA: isoamylase early set domain-containing protein [Gemmatimonadales bacterium]